MKKNYVTVLATLSVLSYGNARAKEPKPNIIIIMTDDMGYGDISANTHLESANTPNIDRIAQNGILFTQGYASAAMCLPSRVGMLSGCYPAHQGAYTVNSLQGVPGDRMIISEYLKKEGYATGVIGKWHVGGEFIPWQRPLQRGFDRAFWWFDSTHDYWRADIGRSETWGECGYAPIYDQDKIIPKYNTGYLTSDIGTQSIAFIEKNHDKPFFLYVPHHCAHVPLQVSKQVYDKYAPLGYGKNTTVTRGMYDVLDQYVGKLLDKLKEYGILENTMIVFMSDNGGGEPDGQLNDVFRGGKFTFLEGGIRVPFIISCPSKITGNRIYNYPVMNIDILPTILDLVGSKLEKPVDGVSLLPYLNGEKKGEPHHTLYWSGGLEAKSGFAIRKGDWKLVSTDAGVGLFNLKDDPTELYDMRSKHPEIASELKSDFENWDKKSCTQSFSPKILNTWHSAQDSVKKLNRKYHYSSTFGED